MNPRWNGLWSIVSWAGIALVLAGALGNADHVGAGRLVLLSVGAALTTMFVIGVALWIVVWFVLSRRVA